MLHWLTLVVIMAGLLLHAMAGTPAGGFCFSHFAAVPLLPPSTPRAPSLSLSLCCGCLARVAFLVFKGALFVEARDAAISCGLLC